MAIMIPAGITSLWIGSLLDKRPIDWVAYSQASFINHINHDKTVLVYFGADWDLSSKFVEQKSFEAPRIRRIIRSRGVIAMKADLTDRSRESMEALNSIGRHSTPVVAIYNSKPTGQPIILDGLFREAELFDAMTTAAKRW